MKLPRPNVEGAAVVLGFALAMATAGTLTATSARAETSEIDACADASEKGQRLRDEGHFRAARSELLTCARKGCPGIVARDCVEFLADLDARAPSIVVRATRANGDDATDVTLTIDGEEVPSAAAGRPIAVDPGPHTLRFASAGEAPVERTIVAREREAHRDVSVSFAPHTQVVATTAGLDRAAPTNARASSASRLSAPVVALGAVGLTALAVGGVLGIKSVVDRGSYDACKPHCDPAAIDGTKRVVLVADVVGGVGLAATLVATLVYFGGSGTTRRDGPTGGAPTLALGPGTLTAGWRGEF